MKNDPKKQGTTISVSLERAELLRETFKGNEDLLKAIRGLFFGFVMTEQEKALVRTTFANNPQLKIAVQFKIYQKLSKEAPIGANPDFWVGTEQQIVGMHPEVVQQILQSKERCLERLEKAMTLLDDPDAFRVEHVADYSPKSVVNDLSGVELISRNLYVQAIENGLSYIKIIASMSDEDMKKVKESREKDSTK